MLVALLLGGAAAFLVACGDSNGLLSSGQSGKLSGELDAISQAVSKGNCHSAEQRSANLRDDVNALPSKVDSKLLKALQDGAVTISSRAAKDCTNPATTQQTLQTQTQTATTTAPPVTTPTTTTPVQTTTTPTTPTETTPPATGTSPNGGAGTDNGAGSGGAGG
jgi:cell division septation protein DedD